jgi:glycosyltransferase involved in cell wall biosynthesis
MKILQVSSASSFGGGERYLVDLANTLAGRGHELYAALRPNSPTATHLRLPPDRLRFLPLRNAIDAPSAQALASLVRKQQIDVIHAHMARDYSLAAYAARRNPKTKLIVTRHVLFPLNRFHRRTLSHAAAVIAVSAAVGRQLESQGLVPTERIAVIPNGIDVSRFDRAKSRLNRRGLLASLRLPVESLLVGSIGELRKLKRHDDFIRAAANLVPQFPQANFVVAGVDPSLTKEMRSELERLITELNLNGRVQLLGWLDNAEELVCALDIFVSASETESFGLAIGEAMTAGAAVVSTATEGASELIEDGINGVLVPIGDVTRMTEEIALLLSDEDRRHQLGVRARERINKRFCLQRMVDEIEELYAALLIVKTRNSS